MKIVFTQKNEKKVELRGKIGRKEDRGTNFVLLDARTSFTRRKNPVFRRARTEH